jgi:MoaA/NifB/PqqE/SkfB family radical SAM enzyme
MTVTVPLRDARTPALRVRDWAGLAWFGLTTVMLRRQDPIVGSLIVTDRCNLACRHCAVANIRAVNYPFERLSADLVALYAQGVRILFLYGGEPCLWRDHDRHLVDVVAEARRIGFPMVNVVTNGTCPLDLPGADVLMVSVDGSREHHDEIRGRTYDRVLTHVRAAATDRIVLYMAVNRINLDDIEHVCRLSVELPTVQGVAFNLHTPYPGTEALTLTPGERRAACAEIARMIDCDYPVLNLRSVLARVAEGRAPTGPCAQCVIVEDGEQWTCGRCSEIPGLCQQCGFLFAAELGQLFRGDPRAIVDALRTYPRFGRQPGTLRNRTAHSASR